MSAIPTPLLTPEQYLAQERLAQLKSEYYRGEVFAMAGASFEHTRIKDNLARQAGNQLESGPCQALTSDLRVKVNATGLYTYPDMVIICGEPKFEDANVDTLLNPQIIVEVLSDSTETYDRRVKFSQYRQIPSFREYLLVAQDEPLAERFVRQPAGDWLLTVFNDIGSTLELATVAVRIPLAEVYRGITFPEKVRR